MPFHYESIPELDQNPERYGVNRSLGGHVLKVIGGETTLRDDFPVMPVDFDAPREAGNIIPEAQDVLFAIGGAAFAETYGPTVERLDFSKDKTIGAAARRMNDTVSTAFEGVLSRDNFKKLFYEKELWRSLVSPDMPGGADMRQFFESLDGQTADDPRLDFMIDVMRQKHFVPEDKPLAHQQSHLDVIRYTNTTLAIAQKELGIRSPDALKQLMRKSRLDVHQLARLSGAEFNTASSHFTDPDHSYLWDRELFVVDREDTDRPIRLDEAGFMNRILAIDPQAARYVRRGCPALFHRTVYGGKKIAVFEAMFDTLDRMYEQTGALTHYRKRDTEELEVSLVLPRHALERVSYEELKKHKPGSV